MSWKRNVLVLASATADSGDLMKALVARAEVHATTFTLVVPHAGADSTARAEAQRRLDAALQRAHGLGLSVDGLVGDSDPIVAVSEAYDPRRFDEIIVSTLPEHASHWMRIDLPYRVRSATGARVIHIQAGTPQVEQPSMPSRGPAPPRRGMLAALTPLTWARRRRERPGTAQAGHAEPRVG